MLVLRKENDLPFEFCETQKKNSGNKDLNMINIISIKKNHTLYEILKSIVKDFDHNVNILGLDSPGGINEPAYLNRENFELPFFLYLEEPSTFDGITSEDAPWDPINREVLNLFLDNKNFVGFISHIKDTCRLMTERYKKNCYHLPLSSSNKDLSLIGQRIKSLRGGRSVNLFASSSWQDVNGGNFFNRGGVIIDELITRLLNDDVDINLTYKTPRSLSSQNKYPKNINIIGEYLPKKKLEDVMYKQDIFLLPSRQVHSASLTEAFSFGMPCVVSNGWGMSEFCVDDLNCLMYEIKSSSYERGRNQHYEDYLNNIIPRIKKLCNNRELLIKKSENTLSWYLTNHCRENHINNFDRLLNLAMRRKII